MLASRIEDRNNQEDEDEYGHGVTASVTGTFALRRISIPTAREWPGVPDVVFKAELREHALQLMLEHKAEHSADALLLKAQVEADGIVRRARQQARALGDTQLKLWQEAFDARQDELSESLGQAVSVVVESIVKSLLGSSADLPVLASIELAMRVLNSELRRSAVCHPLDLPLVLARTERLGTATAVADPTLPRGQIVFSGTEGEVRVDGQRVMDRLMADLRLVLSSKTSPPTAAS